MIEHQFETKEVEEGFKKGRELGAKYMIIKTNDIGVDDEMFYVYSNENVLERVNELVDKSKKKIRSSIIYIHPLKKKYHIILLYYLLLKNIKVNIEKELRIKNILLIL